jgi:hypothetical protein
MSDGCFTRTGVKYDYAAGENEGGRLDNSVKKIISPELLITMV